MQNLYFKKRAEGRKRGGKWGKAARSQDSWGEAWGSGEQWDQEAQEEGQASKPAGKAWENPLGDISPAWGDEFRTGEHAKLAYPPRAEAQRRLYAFCRRHREHTQFLLWKMSGYKFKLMPECLKVESKCPLGRSACA